MASEPTVSVSRRTQYCHAEYGNCAPGKTIRLPKSEAKKLVKQNYAQPADDEAKKALEGRRASTGSAGGGSGEQAGGSGASAGTGEGGGAAGSGSA